jgi:PAS domain S-box-containing protein
MTHIRKVIPRKWLRKAYRKYIDPVGELIGAFPLGLHRYQCQPNGDLIFMGGNPAADQILGIDHRTLIGKPIQAAFPNLVQTDLPEVYRQIAQTGSSLEREFVTYQDGQVKGIFKIQAFQTGPANMAVLFQDIRDNQQTKQALAESEERYRMLVELSPEAIAVHCDGILVYINPAGARQLGMERPEDLLGIPIMDLLPPETRQLNLEMLAQVAQGRTLPPLEQTILRTDGSAIEVEMIAGPVLFQGKPAFQLIVRDISERKRAENALRESEARYRRLFEGAVLGIFQSSPDGKALAVNPAFARMFGYLSPEEVVETVQNVAVDIFADPNRRAEIARMAVENPGINTFENLYRRKDGSTFPGSLYLHPVKDAQGRVICFEGLIEDISERKRAEAQIHDLAKFPEENPNPVARISREGVLLFANQATTPLLASFGRQFDTPLPPAWLDYIGQVLEDRLPKEIEIQLVGRIYSFQLIPIPDEGYVNIYGMDITQRKEAESALLKSEARFRALLESTPLGLHQYELLPDGQLVLTETNPAADHILGIDHGVLIGLPIEAAFPAHLQTQMPAIYRQVAQEGTPYTSDQLVYQDQQIQGIFEIHAFQTGPSRMAVFFQDVTAKKNAEEALRESEEKFRALIEQNSEGVILTNEQGQIIEWNAAQERGSGIPRAEALGKMIWDMQYQVLPPEQKNPAVYNELKNKVLQLVQTGQSSMFYHPQEASIHRPDGKQVFIQQTAFPIKTQAGFRIGSIMRDITERKQAELELERRMAELEALHAVALAGTEAVSTDDLLERVAKIIREKLFLDHFGVAFLDEQAQALVYHPYFVRDAGLPAGQAPLDRGISGVAARTGLPQRVADVRLNADYLEGNPDTRSELCVPILIGSRVVGVANLESATLNNFTEADERLVTAITGELGTALEKIRLLEAEQNRRKELETLEQISAVLRSEEDPGEVLQAVLEQIMAVLNLRGAGIALRERHTGELVIKAGRGEWMGANGYHVPPDESVSQQILQTRHYYLTNDVPSDPKLQSPYLPLRVQAFLCLALIVDGQTQGLLYLGRNRAFIHPDVHLAIAAADVLASVLHQVDLHEQTQQQLDRLKALRAIDQAILAGLDLQQTLKVLLEKITGLLHVDAANVLLYQPTHQTLITAAELGLPAEPIWDVAQVLKDTHAGKAALNRQMEFIPDLNQLDDYLIKKIRRLGKDFTSYVAVPLVANGELKGVLQIFNQARLEASADWMGFLEALADQAAIAISSAQLFTDQQHTNARLTKAYEDTIDGWSRALDLRDEETEGHSQRVTDLTLDLARRIGVPDEQLVHIRRGARLHDIGKMGIPDSILLKPGTLTPEEWTIMRKHPTLAADFLYPIAFLGPALEIPYGHHEKWDGTGYPQGLSGKEIPLAARIFAVIDVWDALTHNRSYRPAWSQAEALAYIRAQSGKHFDPQVVEHFLALAEDRELV